MISDDKLIWIYNEAYAFLQHKVSSNVLHRALDYYETYKPKELNQIFRRMVDSLKNKQGYTNFIAKAEEMKDILCSFDPHQVINTFGNDWELLLDVYKDTFGAKYKIDPNNKRNAWLMFSKGVLSCAKFLASFKTVDEFDAFVRSFFFNEYTIAALPLLLDKEIFGYGFPLACDFLKELGYTKYGKPDIHLKDIFMQTGIVESDSEYEIFKQIVKIGHLVNREPVIVDKVFWLIGSGLFYESDLKIGRQKEAFISHVKSHNTD